VFQSVVDAYVNCEKIGRKITRSVLDLFAYKKKFKPNKVEFRIAQRGYGRNVHSRYLVSLERTKRTKLTLFILDTSISSKLFFLEVQ
jgi:uncharacterized protein (UPF0248 family)